MMLSRSLEKASLTFLEGRSEIEFFLTTIQDIPCYSQACIADTRLIRELLPENRSGAAIPHANFLASALSESRPRIGRFFFG